VWVSREEHRLHLARVQRRHGRQVAARAVTAQRDPPRVDLQLLGVRDRVLEGGLRVVRRGRERVLGREPVVRRQHPHPALDGQVPAQVVVAVQVTADPAATVVEDQQRRARGQPGRFVEPRADAVQRQRPHRHAADDRTAHQRAGAGHGLAVVGGRGRLPVLAAELLQPQQQLRLRVEPLAVEGDGPAGDQPAQRRGQAEHEAQCTGQDTGRDRLAEVRHETYVTSR
jgi:hypothetical protein